MAGFTVEAVDNAGKRVKFDIEAGSSADAITKIKAKGLKPVDVKAKAGTAMFMGRVKHKQLTQFTQQLSVLMDAGLPVVRSLKILANQMKPSLLKNQVTEVAEDVETGSSLSEALNKHPKTFDKLYVNMVKAGEAGGVLDIILQ